MQNPTRVQVIEIMREYLDLDVSDNCVDFVSFIVANESYDSYEDIVSEICREVDEYKIMGMY